MGMIISSKGRYALRVMLDLAEHYDGGYIPLKDIAERQGISKKYVEGIMASLSKSQLIDGQHGKGGGYRLSEAPENTRVGDVLRVAEGSLAPVVCLESGEVCERASSCKTLPMWNRLGALIDDFFDNISLADLMEEAKDGYLV